MPDNPARWEDLKAMGFESPVKLSRGNHPSLPYPQMPAFMADLRAREAVSARALEFLILTNVRTDAVLNATWEEFDLEQAVWIVPLVHLKDRAHGKEGFRVPLPSRAVQIVRRMQEARLSPFVFPGQARGKPLSNMALLTLLKRMNSGDDKKWIDSVSRRPIALTKREGQLVSLLSQGLKNKEIASMLLISEGTVKVYLSRLFQKVGVKDRFELALYGLKNLTTGHGTLEKAPVSSERSSVPEALPMQDLRALFLEKSSLRMSVPPPRLRNAS